MRSVPTSSRSLSARAALLGLAVVGSLAIAACNTSLNDATPTPSAATVSAPPSPNLHAAPDLEALLPDMIGGTTISKVSMSGTDFLALGSETSRAQLQDMLKQLGRSVADLTVADTFDPNGTVTDQAAIFRVKGADPTKLLGVWVASQRTATQGSLTVSSATIGGRLYTRLDDRSQNRPAVSYVLSSGDAVYIVASSDQGIVSAAMAKMVPG